MTPTKAALVFILTAWPLTDACWPHTRTEHKVVVIEVQKPALSSSEQQRVRAEDTHNRIQVSAMPDPCALCINGEECRNGRCTTKAAENHPSAPREQRAPTSGKNCFLDSDCGTGRRCDWDTRVCVAKSRMNEPCKKSFDCADFPGARCEGVCKPFSG